MTPLVLETDEDRRLNDVANRRRVQPFAERA